MTSESDPESTSNTDTGGGAYVDGDVDAGNDFVGRDKTIYGDEVLGDKVLGDKILGDKITVTEETAYNIQGLINPYLGLRAFGYEDRAIYAGREKLAQESAATLTNPITPQSILFITGASGSGKSSFAQAALLPLLESHYAVYGKKVRYAIFRPSSQPMVMLADALQRLYPDLTPETLAANTPKDQINLLLIDQFEELFIQSDASQRAPFCDFLTNLPSFADSRTHISITLRVDYLDELFAIQPLWAIAKEGVELRTMPDDDLRNAIQKPLQVNHPQKRFAPELLDRLVQDANADAALLPLLQVTLAELWKSGRLVLSNYHSLTDAIRQRADTVYNFSNYDKADPQIKRSPDDQQELIAILLDLINVSVDGDDRRDVRQRRIRQELKQGSPQRPRLIEELVNARLLTAASEIRNCEDVEVIDIIHESLIDNWDRLRQAIEAQRQQLQRRARFKLWLGEWVRNGWQDGYLLLTDMQLAEARVLVEARDIEVQGVDAQEFYLCSLKYQASVKRAKDKVEAERKTRQQWLQRARIALVITVIAAGAFLWLWHRSEDARYSAEIARNESERLKEQIQADRLAQVGLVKNIDTTLDHSPILALQLASAGVMKVSPSIASTTQILNDLLLRTTWEWLGKSDQPITKVAYSPDRQSLALSGLDGSVRIWRPHQPYTMSITFGRHQDEVTDLTYSPDGKMLASSSIDKTIHIWSITDPKQDAIILAGHQDGVTSIAFSPDGRLLASASKDHTIRLWTINDINSKPIVLTKNTKDVFKVHFSNDGQILTSVNRDGTIQLWSMTDLESQPQQFVLDFKHEGEISYATFSPDDRQLAVAFETGQIQLWSLTEPDVQSIVTLKGSTDRISSLAFSPDGHLLAAANWDQTIQFWSLSGFTDLPIITLKGHENVISTIAFASDGKTLISGSYDSSIRLWTLSEFNGEPRVRDNYQYSLWDVAFSPDGSQLATSRWDDRIVLWYLNDPFADPLILKWDTEDEPQSTSTQYKYNSKVAFSSDGNSLAAGGWDGAVRLWLLSEPNSEPKVFKGHKSAVLSVAFALDGKTLGSSSFDNTIRLWSIANPELEPVILSGPTNQINRIVFSPNGELLAAASHDSKIYIWSTNNLNSHPSVLKGHEKAVTNIAFSPDGRTLASGSYDNSIRLWSLDNSNDSPIVLKGHENAVTGLVFLPDGKTLISASLDKTVRLWDLDNPNNESWVITEQPDAILTISASPDGKKLAIGSYGGSLKLIYPKTEDIVDFACNIVNENPSWSVWQNYASIEDYSPVCPRLPIPDDIRFAVREKAKEMSKEGQMEEARSLLDKFNKWVRVSGQFDDYKIDFKELMNEEGRPIPTPIPWPHPES